MSKTPITYTDMVDDIDMYGIENHLLRESLDTTPETYTDMPQLSDEIWQYLLSVHMTWVQPLFGFVRKTAFLREQEPLLACFKAESEITGDIQEPRSQHSSFSPFALYSLCAHACRHRDIALISDSDSPASADLFLKQARILAFREVSRGSSLSAISGLICLSAKEVAIGEVCRAWIYQ